jgi:hypothetical protein
MLPPASENLAKISTQVIAINLALIKACLIYKTYFRHNTQLSNPPQKEVETPHKLIFKILLLWTRNIAK